MQIRRTEKKRSGGLTGEEENPARVYWSSSMANLRWSAMVTE
jgi:hypothetical protein